MTPLHQLGEMLRQVLLSVPLWAVRVLFVATLAGLLVWVIRLPRSMTTPPSGAKRWDENLKTGAIIALLIQMMIYVLL